MEELFQRRMWQLCTENLVDNKEIKRKKESVLKFKKKNCNFKEEGRERRILLQVIQNQDLSGQTSFEIGGRIFVASLVLLH